MIAACFWLLANFLAAPAAAQSPSGREVLETPSDVTTVSAWVDDIMTSPQSEKSRRLLDQFVRQRLAPASRAAARRESPDERNKKILERRERALEQALRLNRKLGDDAETDQELSRALDELRREKKVLNDPALSEQRRRALEQALRLDAKLGAGGAADQELTRELARLRDEGAVRSVQPPPHEPFVDLIGEAYAHYVRGEPDNGLLALRAAMILRSNAPEGAPSIAASDRNPPAPGRTPGARSVSAEESALAQGYFWEGERLDDEGKTDEAARAFQQALLHDPGNNWIKRAVEEARANAETGASEPAKVAAPPKKIEPAPVAPASAPEFLAPEAAVSSLTLKWKPTAGATAYVFYPSGGGAPLETAQTSLAISGLTANAAYGGALRAKNQVGLGPLSAPVTFYTAAASPRGVSISHVGVTSMTVTWDPNGNPPGTTFLVSRASPRGPSLNFGAAGTGVILTDLKPGTTYTIEIRAQNAASIESAAAAVEAATNPRVRARAKAAPKPAAPIAPIAPPAALAAQPAAPAAQPAARPAPESEIYLTRDGDTLWGLARKRYGDGHLWVRIRNANPGLPNGGNSLPPGTRLVIPPARAKP